MKFELRISGGKKLKSPSGIRTRPTTSRVREAVMNILREKIKGASWLDLFSGSGSMGCEALLNGALKVLAVEKDRKTAQICKDNLITTLSGLSKKQRIGVIQNEVVNFLGEGSKKIKAKGFDSEEIFDLVYIDPPYKEELIYTKVLSGLIKGNWIYKSSIVICEHSSDITIKPDPLWIEIDRKHYGSSSLLLISPPG